MAKARKEGCEAKAKPREERVDLLSIFVNVTRSRYIQCLLRRSHLVVVMVRSGCVADSASVPEFFDSRYGKPDGDRRYLRIQTEKPINGCVEEIKEETVE